VEVKGYDTSLTDSHRSQLNSYLRQTDVDWGLLTNGEKYEILRRENVPQGVEVQTVADIQLSELPYRADYVSLLSKEALESGHAEELAQRIFDIRGARQKLKEHKDKISEEITDTLTEFAGEVVSQEAKTEAKVLVDRLVEELEDQTEEIETVEIDESTEQKSFWSEVEENTGIVRTEDSVQLDESKTAADNYADFIKFLFKSDYLSRADLPIESGRIRYILNTEIQHKDGSDMTNPKEIIDGIFLETHQNTANKKKRIVELGEKFGSS
jgi:hypothetical protein